MKLLVCAIMLLPYLNAARIQLVNLLPEEAQSYIAQQALDLRYANKLGESPLSSSKTRSYGNPDRTLYFNGREIENLDDYIEEEYEANQFHGQDGLGRVMYGYTDHNQAKMEARNINGEVRGSYKYMSPDGKEILVEYWSDELGFHQKDNVDRSLPEAATETPEVRAARLAHEEAWNKAAEAAALNPDPDSDLYNRAANQYDEEQNQYEQKQELLGGASNQHQSLARYPSLPYSNHIAPGSPLGVAPLRDSIVVDAAESRQSKQLAKPEARANEAEEVTSEPRGFFYSFDYPVQLIKENPARSLKVKRQAPSPNIQKIRPKNAPPVVENLKVVEKPTVTDDVSVESVVEEKLAIKAVDVEAQPEVKAVSQDEPEVIKPVVKAIEVEAKPDVKAVTQEDPEVIKPVVRAIEVEAMPEVKSVVQEDPEVIKPAAKFADPESNARISLQATLEDAIPIDAVHDAQVHPNQKSSLVDSQKKSVLIHD